MHLQACRQHKEEFEKKEALLHEEKKKNESIKTANQEISSQIQSIIDRETDLALSRYHRTKTTELRNRGVRKAIPKKLHTFLIWTGIMKDPATEVKKDTFFRDDKNKIDKIKRLKQLIDSTTHSGSLTVASDSLTQCYTDACQLMLEGLLSPHQVRGILLSLSRSMEVSTSSCFDSTDRLTHIDPSTMKTLIPSIAKHQDQLIHLQRKEKNKKLRSQAEKEALKVIEQRVVDFHKTTQLLQALSSLKTTEEAFASVVEKLISHCQNQQPASMDSPILQAIEEKLRLHQDLSLEDIETEETSKSKNTDPDTGSIFSEIQPPDETKGEKYQKYFIKAQTTLYQAEAALKMGTLFTSTRLSQLMTELKESSGLLNSRAYARVFSFAFSS